MRKGTWSRVVFSVLRRSNFPRLQPFNCGCMMVRTKREIVFRSSDNKNRCSRNVGVGLCCFGSKVALLLKQPMVTAKNNLLLRMYFSGSG